MSNERTVRSMQKFAVTARKQLGSFKSGILSYLIPLTNRKALTIASLIVLVFLLVGCAGSTIYVPVKQELVSPPPSMKLPCQDPDFVPSGTARVVETHWKIDRMNLIKCAERFKKLIEFYNDRDLRYTETPTNNKD